MIQTQNDSIGLIGLGVMGRNLALNLRDHDIATATWDPWEAARDWQAQGIHACKALADLVATLPRPRNILLMLKAGQPVDDMINQLILLLDAGDCIIDGGNAHFADTDRRSASLREKGFQFIGLGVSGGAEGARHGPAMMAGGSEGLKDRVSPLLQAIVAQKDDIPCFGWFGSGGAGHYVKMVHNGIEYAVMQAIAEVCHTLHYAAGQSWPDVAACLGQAEQGYLVEITREILGTRDDLSNRPLIDVIDDGAGQKGTGGWCVADALDLGIPVPSIAQAVAARQISSLPLARKEQPEALPAGSQISEYAGAAVDVATAVALTQGFALAIEASRQRKWQITIPAMATSWRAGSILRMPLLSELQALDDQVSETALPPPLQRRIAAGAAGLRRLTTAAITAKQPVPVLSATVNWIDSLRMRPLPTAIVQAQRDRFGDHGFRRTDRDGTFHGPWNRTGA